MSLRLRRPAALIVPLLLLGLTACGGDSEGKTAEGFDAVEISGQPGETPEFDWKAKLASGDVESEVLDEGDGAELAAGDQVLVNFALSDDFSKKVAFDTYGEDAGAMLIEVGAEAEPQSGLDLLKILMSEHIEEGMTIGTRVALTVDAKEEWDETAVFLAEAGVGNEDGLALVFDVVSVPLDGPEGKTKAAPSWAPEIVVEDGVPTAIDSSDVAKPDVKAKTIRSAVLVEGTGPEVDPGSLAVVNYLGQTWGGKEPFDQSYGKKGTPLNVLIAPATVGGGTSVIEGWSAGLEGVPVGSRVLIQIPPAKGYGEQGSPPDIKGDDILYFVVDVLASA